MTARLGTSRGQRHGSKPGQHAGFTLAEILVAVAVLSILLAILVETTTSINQVLRLSKELDDPSSQSRIAFDRIGRDLAGLIKRSDTDFQAHNVTTGAFSSSNSHDLLLFLSETPSASTTTMGQADNRGLSLVAYQVSIDPDNNSNPCLVRASLPVSWSGANGTVAAGFMGLQGNGLPVSFDNVPAALLPSTVSDFDVLSPGTIRMVVGFQLYPDNKVATLQDGSTVANAIGQVVYQPPVRSLTPSGGGAAVTYLDLTRISALVIGIVVLNVDNLKMLTSTQVSTLGNSFATPPAGTLPVAAWTPVVENPALLPTSIPLVARQSIHVFQHFYPVNPVGANTW